MATAKIVKTLPASESGHGILCKTKTHGEYQISQNPSVSKNRFTLWKLSSEGYEKISQAATPQDLYPLIPWD